MFYRVSTAEEIDTVGDQRSGNATTVDIQTLLEIFLNMSLRYSCFNNTALFTPPSEKQKCRSWDYSPQLLDYQDFQIIWHQIKGILSYKFSVYVTVTDVSSQLLFVLL
jgi:hypothetical protein